APAPADCSNPRQSPGEAPAAPKIASDPPNPTRAPSEHSRRHPPAHPQVDYDNWPGPPSQPRQNPPAPPPAHPHSPAPPHPPGSQPVAAPAQNPPRDTPKTPQIAPHSTPAETTAQATPPTQTPHPPPPQGKPPPTRRSLQPRCLFSPFYLNNLYVAPRNNY